MRELEQRQNPLRLLGLRLFLIALLLMLVGLLRGIWGVYEKERETYGSREQAEQELAELNDRAARLKSDIARLRTDEGIEESLRQQFGMAKDGEGVIVIVDQNAQEKKEEKAPNVSTVSGWKRLLPLAPWKLFGQ